MILTVLTINHYLQLVICRSSQVHQPRKMKADDMQHNNAERRIQTQIHVIALNLSWRVPQHHPHTEE